MKIVRVTHQVQESDLEIERMRTVLEDFDVEGFVSGWSFLWNGDFRASLNERMNPVSRAIFAGTSSPKKHAEREKQDALSFAESVLKRAITKFRQDACCELDLLDIAGALSRYPNTSNLTVGTYTLHPCDSQRLTRLDHYHRNLALEKDDELIVILGKMGAVEITKTEHRHDGTSIGGSAAASVGVPSAAGVSAQFNGSKTREKGSSMAATYEGRTVAVDPNLLKNSLWFRTDSRLNALLEARLFSDNRITSYTVTNTYSEGFDFDFKVAGRYLASKADLRAEYEHLSKTVRHFHVTFPSGSAL